MNEPAASITSILETLKAGCRRVFTSRNLREVLVGAVVFYGCEGLFDFFENGPGRDNIPSRILFLAFTLGPPLLLSLVTVWLYRRVQKPPYTIWPEFNLLFGSIIFVPFYFVFASRLIYQPRPMDFREIVEDLFLLYALLPFSLISLPTYSFSLGPLILSAVATVLTGWCLRKRTQPGQSRPQNGFGLERLSPADTRIPDGRQNSRHNQMVTISSLTPRMSPRDYF